jgi:hypothetical protein
MCGPLVRAGAGANERERTRDRGRVGGGALVDGGAA